MQSGGLISASAVRLRLITVLAVTLLSGSLQAQVTLNVATGTAGLDYWLLQSAVNRFMLHNPDIEVRVLLTPELTDDRLTLLRNFFEVGSPELDVLQLDVIWMPELAPHLLELSSLQATAGAIHPRLLEQMTVDDRLVAMPWFSSFGLLYYRSDLLAEHDLAVPRTWTELTETARTVQAAERAAGNRDFWGFVWQGDDYEGLTVNAIEWFASSRGGRLIELDGTISVANGNAARALERARSWIGDISPPAVLSFTEDDAFEQFVHGNALFMRSWPSYHAQLRDSPRLMGRYGVTLLPAGETAGSGPTGVYGGSGLAVSAYSREPAAALRLVEFLSSESEQRAAAWDGSRIPTRSELWFDREVITAIPFLPELLPLHSSAVRRPVWLVNGMWSNASRATYSTVHSVLRGEEDAGTALEQLAGQLQLVTGLPDTATEPFP